jgi:hypothetical protein
MNSPRGEEEFLEHSMSEIVAEHGKEVAKDRYAYMQKRLQEIYDARKAAILTATPPMSDKEKNMREAIFKIGAGIPKDQKMDPWGHVEIQKIFEGTRRWHLAAARVFEYCEAQINMDLFKGDEEATQIFKQLIIKGFQALQNEANPNYGRNV